MQKLLGLLLPPLVVFIAALFGYSLEPDNQILVLFTNHILAAPIGVQVGLFVALWLLATLPHIAPYTPWTWDDWTIKYQGKVRQLLGHLWNAITGNYGKANNKRE